VGNLKAHVLFVEVPHSASRASARRHKYSRLVDTENTSVSADSYLTKRYQWGPREVARTHVRTRASTGPKATSRRNGATFDQFLHQPQAAVSARGCSTCSIRQPFERRWNRGYVPGPVASSLAHHHVSLVALHPVRPFPCAAFRRPVRGKLVTTTVAAVGPLDRAGDVVEVPLYGRPFPAPAPDSVVARRQQAPHQPRDRGNARAAADG